MAMLEICPKISPELDNKDFSLGILIDLSIYKYDMDICRVYIIVSLLV